MAQTIRKYWRKLVFITCSLIAILVCGGWVAPILFPPTPPVGAVETRYMANQLWEAGLYNLSLSQTASGVDVAIAENQESTWTMYLGIKPYIILANNTKWSMTDNAVVAIASKLISGVTTTWTVSAEWTHDQINQSGIGIEVEIYVDKDTNPPTTLRATFRTENMTFSYVTSNTWTVYYAGRTIRAGVNPYYTYSGYWRFGHSTGYNSYIDGFEVDTDDFDAPIIEDFYINNTWCGYTAQFAFNITDNLGLDFGKFGCNITGTFQYDAPQALSGTLAWLNVTKVLPAVAGTVEFEGWFNDTKGNSNTTGLRYMKCYVWQEDYTETKYLWGQNQTTYGLQGYSLNSTQSTVYQNVSFIGPGTSQSYWAITIIEYTPEEDEYSIGDTVAEVTALTTGQFYNGTWTRTSPYTFHDTNSILKVLVLGDLSYPASTVRATFITPQLNAYQLFNSTWKVCYWIVRTGIGTPEQEYYWNFRWGNSTYPSQIQNTTVSYFHRNYHSLISALTDIADSAVWGDSPYAATIFDEKAKSNLSDIIDNYAAVSDWQNVLKWSAICWKLGVERQTAIEWALGNYTMVDKLPYGGIYGGEYPAFITEYKYLLYGYYWAVEYDANLTKWNITAAFQQFNTSIYNYGHPALYVFAEWTAFGYSRYYDEGACTIECYILFSELLNVTGALDDAAHWWNWINVHHWYNVYYVYMADDKTYTSYECEAGFFLKIISILKYYKAIGNWSRVLDDIYHRFLSDYWQSKQWMDSKAEQTTYTVIHHYTGATQRRLQNTLGAWFTMLGVYPKYNETAQAKMLEMISGYSSLEPAWSLLLRPEVNLFSYSTKQFKWESDKALSNEATVYALDLMFMLGIIPETSSIAFPLEELNYEYIQDIDMDCFQINLTTRKVRVAVADNGTISFQYGVSPVTHNFTQGDGVYEITFSNSWNMITSVSRIGDLPTNRIYFAELYKTTLNVGWNTFYGLQPDIGHTLGEVNASLNLDGVNWTYCVLEYVNGTRYPFVYGFIYNSAVSVTSTNDVFYVYCNEAGEWTHTYP